MPPRQPGQWILPRFASLLYFPSGANSVGGAMVHPLNAESALRHFDSASPLGSGLAYDMSDEEHREDNDAGWIPTLHGAALSFDLNTGSESYPWGPLHI